MSIHRKSRRTLTARLLPVAALAVLCVCLGVCLGMCPAARAQYVGRINTATSKPTLRATAVLEYTGSLAHPTASRLVPIAVWDGENYQPGGLYLAQPVPLTVQAGTQYVLEQTGALQGYFDVQAASREGDSWFAIGKYQKPAPPAVSHLKPSRVLPKIIGGEDSTPHFAHVPATGTSSGAAQSASAPAPKAPPAYPGRPTLTDRPANTDNTGNTGAAGDTGQQQASTPAPPIYSGRPILREPSASTASGSAAGAPETVSQGAYSGRPHLAYGAPTHPEQLEKEAQLEVQKLAGPLPEIEQMVAVSDAVSRPPHSYVYSWDSPEAEAKMETAVEKAAQNLLAAGEKPATAAHVSRRRTRRARRYTRKPVKPASPVFTNVEFRAFQLAYGSGATLVFSATSGTGPTARYITLIAQPDFSGTPIVLFKQITSGPELGVVPRMKFIDAVDTTGDNQADLIFALETLTGRQYAIYQVANGTAQQVFVTGGWSANH